MSSRSWFRPQRATEATLEQLAVTGAAGAYGLDPIDGDVGYVKAGGGPREVPIWTLEKARAYSIAAYRYNPMARAIIDTYTSFCVGDSGVTLQCSSPEVRPVVEEFWTDPRNDLPGRQADLLRSHLLTSDTVLELLVGEMSGVVRYSIIDPTRIEQVTLDRGNPLWPKDLIIRNLGADATTLSIAQIDDITGLRSGQVLFWPDWKALLTDRRGQPFLSPILDWLDSYDQVLSNLVDRTALARYMVWDVTLSGEKADVDDFIAQRKGTHAPASGSVEVHNDKVTWEPKSAPTGASEDAETAKTIMTSVAAGAGLAKTWLAEPTDSNRATSLTMAEPVRRRVGGVQNTWLAHMTEFARYAVDQAVAAGRLPKMVTIAGPDGHEVSMKASATVTVTGPSVATADAQVTASVLVNLAQSLGAMQLAGILSPEAAALAARKGWEDYVGIPYNAALASPDVNPDDVATAVQDAQQKKVQPASTDTQLHAAGAGAQPIVS